MRIFKEYYVGNWLQPVQIGPVALFEKHATATASLVLISLVQFSFQSFFSPMDQTFKHYVSKCCVKRGSKEVHDC